ncbi:MAG: SpoIIE family protein phosphatase [Desulfatirhabdiaceae bacterium]
MSEKKRMTILVADDDPTIRAVLTKTFEKAGFHVISAENGRQALEQMKGDISAVLLDLQMPIMSGLECLRFIRERFEDISPIMLTASDDIANAVEAMKNGAFDYITKPFNSHQLIALVEKAIATDQNTRRIKRLEAELARAREQEIETASRIQQTLLMGKPPAHLRGIEIATRTVPSQKVDGDFYDFFQFGEQYLDVVIGDVMGKGIASALMGAALKSHFLRVIHDLGRSAVKRDSPPDPVAIVSRVQTNMIRQMEDLETFVTLCYGRFDLRRRIFRFVDCGHMRTIHYCAQSNTFRLLEGVNMPLGFPEIKPYTEISVPFSFGDCFFFYSDGLTEAMNPNGDQYGENRLVDSMRANISHTPESLITQVWVDIVNFTHSETFRDDFTSVVVKIGQLPGTCIISESEFEIQCDIRQTSLVRRFLREFCGPGGRLISQERLDLLTLAATEVVTNIIRHAYGDRTDGKIRIIARTTPDSLEITFFDRGEIFDPKIVPPPKFDGSQEGGFGIYIITNAVDEYTYGQDQYGNNCTRLLVSLK